MKDTLKPTILVEYQEQAKKENIEAAFTRVTVDGVTKGLIIIGVYRPPSAPTSWFVTLNNLLLEVIKMGPVILMGDINADMLKPTKHPAKALRQTMAIIDGRIEEIAATRISKSTATCLDVIVIPKEIDCLDYKVEAKATSDHFPVTATINYHLNTKKGPSPMLRRSFKSTDMRALKDRAKLITLSDKNKDDPDALVTEWQSSMIEILDDLAPVRPYPMRRRKCPWMNGDVRKRIADRDKVAKILQSKKPEDHDYEGLTKTLSKLKKSAKSRLRRAAKNYGVEALAGNDHKSAWKLIREVTLTTSTSERSSIDPKTLNESLAKTVTSTSQQQLSLIESCDSEDSFSFRPLLETEVQYLLYTTKTKTAVGHDELSGYLLKSLASEIAPNVTKIFNTSLSQGIFPTSWKKANVSAIWKGKGTKSDPANYRPISVLPVIARLFERISAKQLYEYCEKRELIPARQFGFRARSSCELALLSALDQWMGQVDKGDIVGALLVDLSKAFDTVPHQLLLKELMNTGCAQTAVKWFHSFLVGREQRVIQRPIVTDWMPVTRGVPQGSCLSPILFNIFTRELPLKCQSTIHQFADDITPSESDTSAQVVIDKLSVSFNQIKAFCEEHELTINAAKTQLILMKAPSKKMPNDLVLKLEDSDIVPSQSVKLLGATIDQHLTFGADIDRIVLKCHQLVGVLARSAPFLPTQLLKMAYIALVRTQLEYASAIRAAASKTQLQRLDTIQKIASRIILRAPRNAHSAPLQKTLGLDSLEIRRTNHIVKLVETCMSDTCHPAFHGMFDRQPDGTAANKFTARTGIGRRRFSIFAKGIYNTRLSTDNNRQN